MWESRLLCEISKELWIEWETCLWFSTRSTAPSFPQLSATLLLKAAIHPGPAFAHPATRYPDRTLPHMNENELFQAALGLLPPWLVDHCRFTVESGRLDIYLDFPRGSSFLCPLCA